MKKINVYLAGQWNEHDNNWKEGFQKLDGFTFHDPEVDSDQTSADTYFPDDLKGVQQADVMIANPGLAPSEGTWIEVGYFYATHVKSHGEKCERLIIIWPEKRDPKWSYDFVEKAGILVKDVAEAKEMLTSMELIKSSR